MTPTFADLAKAQYILLTTFTKDGKPKPVPVWAAADGDRLPSQAMTPPRTAMAVAYVG
ncbi:pyridoxamine 5'-phosphate oxidase family protein, partial [Mycobacterium sp. E3247]|uniref:pyridoxamine 5'-phosphate oxidase family protein n=1 Tax=Mycobacterium sp. E3247 TaxID=1856864 RepID=UPI000B039692